MPDSFDLTKLDAHTFEQMVNMLALTVLGAGHTGFGPGADGGRDGFFEGSAPYPNPETGWSGIWYIQSKFHKPHLSKDPQKWLLEQIETELAAFANDERRKWPDNWILATNIEPSGNPETGAFDKAKALVADANQKLAPRFHIWGGRKIIDLLVINDRIAEYYGHFLTPGNVLKSLYDALHDEKASVKDVIRFLIIKEFEAHQFTKLDQAGSEADTRPGVHRLFVDLPFRSEAHSFEGLVTSELLRTSGRAHRAPSLFDGTKWREWRTFPSRSRVWFIQGGPGQGKSTTGQYFSQLLRAALILEWNGDPIQLKFRESASDIRTQAETRGHWSNVPRIPINIELKDYAQWFGSQADGLARGVLPYLAQRIAAYVDKPVAPATIKRALRSQSWFVVFDGLDEVPNDVKDALAAKVKDFINDTTVECDSDVHFICTSRPQGYSGQFDDLECAVVKLIELSPDKALECAEPVIRIGRTETEAQKGITILRSAIASPAVRALMTTPLQSHIMAVVVRDGKKPPERRWQLFENFYQVIKRREANRDLPDERIARLLREEEQLLRTIHNRLGFVLHAQAETSEGAQTSLSRNDFRKLATKTVSEMKPDSTTGTVEALMEATATRLVLVNTPDDGDNLRFDIRQLQEFFAAEFIHDAVTLIEFRERVSALTGDAHWREVIHFLLSAMVESRRLTEIVELAQAIEALNEGESNEQCRTVNRRLARGALLTARILQDGVLEQDKRIRVKFRHSLEPLAATTDTNNIGALYHLEHPDSRNWVIDYCIERIREADYTESVGAAILLTRLLRDGDPRIEECTTLIFSKPSSYQSEVFRSWSRSQVPENAAAAEWIVRLALNRLINADWHQLGAQGVEGAVSLLTRGGNFVASQLDRIGAPQSYFLFIQLLHSDRYVVPTGDDNVEPEEDFGCVSEHPTTFCWNSRFPFNRLNETEPETITSDDFGLFSLTDAIWRFALRPCFQPFSRIVRLIPKNESSIKAIPHELINYIPFNVSETEISKLGQITDVEFDAWLLSTKRVTHLKGLKREYVPSVDEWKRLISKHPAIAVQLSIGGWLAPDTNWFDAPEFSDAILAAVLKNPDTLSHCNILLWGRFLSFPTVKDVDALRQAFTSAASSKHSDDYWHHPDNSRIFPFDIHLPTEFPLVPLVISAAIHFASNQKEIRRHHETNVKELDPVEEVARLIGQFFPTSSLIPGEDCDFTKPTLNSGYRLLLRVLHPEIEDKFSDLLEFIPEIVAQTPDKRFLDIVLFYVRNRYSEEDPTIVRLVSKLMEILRSDFALRKAFHPLLHTWREKSHSPATKAEALAKWL